MATMVKPPMFPISRSPTPMSVDASSDGITRRPYVCPPLWADRLPIPQNWDLTSGNNGLDINEEDGYVLSATGEGSGSTLDVIMPCDPLSAVTRARPGRLRVKALALHRRRVWGASPSHTSQRSILSQPYSINDGLPTPSSPNTDFKNFYNSLCQRDAIPAVKAAPPGPGVSTLPISPPVSPAGSLTPSSPRHQRPVLHVQTSSPVGTSAPPPTPALPSPSLSTSSHFRSSGPRVPKRPALPVWSAEYHPQPRAVVV